MLSPPPASSFQASGPLFTFQSFRSDTLINRVVLCLLVAERGMSISRPELVKQAGLGHAAVSRNMQALGYGVVGEPGLGLVKMTIDPSNPRADAIQLTKDGRDLAARLSTDLVAPFAIALSVEMRLGGKKAT